MNFKLTCAADGFTKTVSAASKDEAVKMFMADPDCQGHMTSAHPDKAGMTPEQMTEMLAASVTEEMAAPAGAMPSNGAM